MIAAFSPFCLLLLLDVVLIHASSQHQAPHRVWLRSAGASATSTSNGNTTATAATNTAVATTTTSAKFHCDYRGEDPDGGIASPFCECGDALETQSWPLMTPSIWIAADNIYSQCAYTAAPVSSGIRLEDKVTIINIDLRSVSHVPLWATTKANAYPLRIAILRRLQSQQQPRPWPVATGTFFHLFLRARQQA